jgi:hypothetical protein
MDPFTGPDLLGSGLKIDPQNLLVDKRGAKRTRLITNTLDQVRAPNWLVEPRIVGYL